MKRLLLLCSIVFCTTVLWAVPSQRGRLKLRLQDGTELFVTSYGDEHYGWFLSDDGRVVQESEDTPGSFVYSPLTPEEVAGKAAQARRAARRIGSVATAPLPVTGSPKVPVVLVNFTDSVFHVGKTDEEIRAYYDLYCNGTRDGQRYTGHGSYGSIRDYFAGQSDSLFQPEFVIIGPVTLNNGVATYGRNGSGSKDVNYSSRFQKDVMQQAITMYDGDWSDFDNKKKGGGNVDFVFFIFAGCGENTLESVPSLIWPKEVTKPETVRLDDGRSITFGASGCCPENRPKIASDKVTVTSAVPDGIGVMCHELSHALGLPDFYDTNYMGFGMDVWSLMDYGCYMQNSYAPVAYTAYERDFMGWRKLQLLVDPGTYTLNPIAADDGLGLKLVNPENENEFYVLEARLATGWDKALARYGKGLQVTHVDYLATRWTGNNVNTTVNHQRMTIIAANNNYNATTSSADPRIAWAGNLYPFEANDSLTAHSVPAATVFSESGFMPHDITQIRISDDGQQISFLFDERVFVGVPEVRDDDAEAAVRGFFDLSGRQVAQPLRPGIYLRGGRKYIIQR